MKQIVYFFACLHLLVYVACNNGQQAIEIEKTNIAPIDSLTKLIAKDNQNAALYLERGKYNFQYERDQEAIADLERALQLDSTNIDHYHFLAHALLSQKQPSSRQAIRTLEIANTRFPKDTSILTELARFNLFIKQHDEAIIQLDKILNLHPSEPRILFMKGVVYKDANDSLKALETLQKTVDIDADFLPAYIELADLTLDLPNNIALRYLDNVMRIDSNHYEGLTLYCDFYHDRKMYEKAIERYRKLIEKHPSEPDPQYNIGLLYLEKGDRIKNPAAAKEDYEHAARHLNNATKFEITFAEANYFAGLAYEKLNNKTKSIHFYEQTLRLQQFLDPNIVTLEQVDQAIERNKL